MPGTLERLPLPKRLADAAHAMAPAYLRRRLLDATTPYLSGDTATFAYVGDARSVRVEHFMSLFPAIPAMERLDGTDLWWVTVQLPKRSRVEYRLVVETAGATSHVTDPLNRRVARDPFGANSVAHGPGYVDPPWTKPRVDAAAGRIETIQIASRAFGGSRTLSVYLPSGHPGRDPYPACFFHDGSDLLEFAGITTVLDNLIAAGAIRPMVGILMDPVDRNREYMALPAHGRFVVEDVLPLAVSTFGVTTDPRARIVAGASLGAVAGLATAWRHPGVFGAAMLLSGTFITELGGPWRRGPELQPIVDFTRAFTAAPGLPVPRTWMACGRYEGLAADNRAFVPHLEAAGIEVTYEESRDGHHWQNWRNNIGDALGALLAPALP